MFIFNPDPFLLPAYKISPFKTDSISFNRRLPSDNFAEEYFNVRFGEGNWHYTINGREAINFALKSYDLKKDDLVTILTTSENFYISSCVTKEIEKFCRWNREILPETKAIFVNHEFGYPYFEMEKLVATGLPIIEDCCTTFFSQDEANKVGKYGDFALYSLPKFFPVQIGGILVSNTEKTSSQKSIITKMEANYVRDVVSYYLRNIEELLSRRKTNFDYASLLYNSVGFDERFAEKGSVVPSLHLLKNNNIIKDLPLLKVYLSNHGILSSVFYGEDAFFLPNHQNMDKFDVEYIFECVINFKNLQV